MASKLKVWHISDTHTYEDMLKVPEGIDMIIHSGDGADTKVGFYNEQELRKFLYWFSQQKAKHKIYVAGNHDTSIEKHLVKRVDFDIFGIHYLENEDVTIEGIKIWGSPMTPRYTDGWSFDRKREDMHKFWKHIPDDVDILVTHGPPKGVLDVTFDRDNRWQLCGCANLRKRVEEIKPAYHFFGHIHNNKKDRSNSGIKQLNGIPTIFSNAACVTDNEFGEITSHGNIFEIETK